ncbi:MAG: 16S rRNA (cytidine(1402)-2'-O)-methyltransferase [bacterium]|nr:16S rRNA (cytidine(1402)-2'-O)-methyltransferase [bacterium]
MAKLFIIATPIGNLEDLTLRGLRILGEVDGIIAEDTRVTQKLLEHYGIKKSLYTFHQHSLEKETEKIARLLEEGKNLALVTDAGTPGISDPGGKLIEDLLKTMPDLEIIPIPGPNAAITALSVAGFPADHFLFLGFPPHKKGRQTFFREMTEAEPTIVFYESTHRILKALEQMSALENLRERPIVVLRELTKKFETIYRGTAAEILAKLQQEGPRGEFVVVIGPVKILKQKAA